MIEMRIICVSDAVLTKNSESQYRYYVEKREQLFWRPVVDQNDDMLWFSTYLAAEEFVVGESDYPMVQTVMATFKIQS